jgi:hypothetical protein
VTLNAPSCEGRTLGNLSIAEGNPHLGGEMTTAGKAPAARFENEWTCSDLQALKSSPRPGGSIPNRGLSIGGAKGTYDGQPYITGLRIAVALGQQSSPPCAPRHNPVSIDGVPRSHRDRKEIAVEAAGRLTSVVSV